MAKTVAVITLGNFLFIHRDGNDQYVTNKEFEVTSQDVLEYLKENAESFARPKDSKPLEVRVQPMEDSSCRIFVGNIFDVDDGLVEKVADFVAARRFAQDYLDAQTEEKHSLGVVRTRKK